MKARRPVFKKFPDIENAPLHPGEILREDVLPLLPLSRHELARKLKLSTAALEDLLAGRRPVTKLLADRLGVVVGYGARYWLGLQRQHDFWSAAIAATAQRDADRPARR